MNTHAVPRLLPPLTALVLMALSIGAHAQPTTPAQWRQAAIQDIGEAVRITRDNHPGMFDPANPAFPANLDNAGKAGLALAERVDGPGAYMAAVGRFNAAIGDGHAGMYAQFPAAQKPKRRWPGFTTVWRRQGLFVYASEEGGPAPGARVVRCDGKPIEDIIRDNVFSFDGRVNEPGRWWSRARMVFLDTGNPFVKLPARCEFAQYGKTVARDLAWKPEDARTRALLDAGYNGQTLDVGLAEVRKGLFWVSMPTFAPDEGQRDAYRAINREVETQRQRFLKADAVVIDLRQNQGGSSFWGEHFAGALWGKERVERRMDVRSARTEVWWRASRDNAKHVASFVETFTQENQVENLDWARRNSAGMQAALAAGEKFYVEKSDSKTMTMDPEADLPTDPPPFTRPVYVIVPGQCASACLDALDVFTRFSNTILVGAPSSADSTYMEVRFQKVGSGLASVVIPTKMYVRRARANGQAYLPSIYVDDIAWTMVEFQQAIEEDLARRAR